MPSDQSPTRGPEDSSPPKEDLTRFLNLLNELKATGCNLLVVGDEAREVFTRASAKLLGDADVPRYRILATTDVAPQSIADRLPDATETPRPLTETTWILNHTGAPRSVTSATNPGTPPKLTGIQERCIADPELEGLQIALTETITDVGNRADDLQPSEIRVGIDSLGPLLDHYGIDVVRRCLDVVGEQVREYDAMAHYVLPDAYESERVQALVPNVDAVIKLRSADPREYDYDAQQRWYVPRQDVTTEWLPL